MKLGDGTGSADQGIRSDALSEGILAGTIWYIWANRFRVD